MKSFTQVVLPIVALAGLVFGITYVVNYSSQPPVITPQGQTASTQNPLKFASIVGRNDPTSWHLKHWRQNFELSETGYFDFWFHNSNEQPVRISFVGASCGCAGADLGILPPDAWDDYVRGSAAAATLGTPASPILAAINTAQMASKLEWSALSLNGKQTDGTVPAARGSFPQMGIVRLNWKGRDREEEMKLTANFATQLPGAAVSTTTLEAHYFIVQPFDVISTSSRGREVRLGELGPNARVEREFFAWSRTRPDLPLAISISANGDNRDCVSHATPERLSPEAIERIPELAAIPGLQSAYRVVLTVQERKEIERDGRKLLRFLDLGPIDFSCVVSAGSGRGITVPVTGIARGDLRIEGRTPDRIEFPSFPSGESRTAHTAIYSDRDGLDLEVVESESTPDYLSIQLIPDGVKDARKSWTLKVTIPANRLFGSLDNGFVILKTKDAESRRIRIPVKASAYSGTPRF